MGSVSDFRMNDDMSPEARQARGVCVKARRGKYMFTLTQRTRRTISILLALTGIGVVVVYTLCPGTCSSLQGSMFGVDLKYLGILFMVMVVPFVFAREDRISLFLVSAGIGAECYLVGFQIYHNVYCSYCLAFGAVIGALFVLHFKWSYWRMMILSVAAGIVMFLLFFKGTVIPTYFGGLYLYQIM
jgi:hypothetical protein